MAQVDAIHRAAAVDGPPTDGYGQMTSKRIADLDGRRVGERRGRQGHRAGPTRSSSTRAPTRWCSSPRRWRPCCCSPRGSASTARPTRRARASPTSASSSSTSGSTSGTTAPTRGRSAAPTTPRARRSAASTSCAAGVTVGLAHDRRSAALAGVESTGQLDRPGVLRRLPRRPVPRRRRRVARAADRRRGAGAARHRLLVQPHPRPEDAGGHRASPATACSSSRAARSRSRCRTSATRSRSSARWPRATCSASATTPQLVSNEGGIVHVPSLRLAAWAFTGNAQG